MAIATNPKDFAASDIKIGPKTATVAFYILIAVVAMSVAIPAAFMTTDAGMFEECYSTCTAQ